ncbi:MAG: acetyl-CoA carboxylase biotin carboxyl carrier protein [Paracoccaceae bacterium]
MSRDTGADVAFIRALAEILREHELGEIEVEREYGEDDELKVRLARQAAAQPVPTPMPAPVAPVAPQAPAPIAAAEAPAAEESDDVVASPMVGTCYLSPEPGADPFVAIGEQVAEGQTLVIIEAMKTMNQIPAPRAGRGKRVVVANAEPVEFGAPLVVLE